MKNIHASINDNIDNHIFRLGKFFNRLDEKYGEKIENIKKHVSRYCKKIKDSFLRGRYPELYENTDNNETTNDETINNNENINNNEHKNN
jgi:hypothetical protein